MYEFLSLQIGTNNGHTEPVQIILRLMKNVWPFYLLVLERIEMHQTLFVVATQQAAFNLV
jgi:hypothetical protein